MKKKIIEHTGYSPPINIHRTSDEVDLIFVGEIKNTTPKQYNYKYKNGLLKGSTVPITEEEIKKQLTNYWTLTP